MQRFYSTINPSSHALLKRLNPSDQTLKEFSLQFQTLIQQSTFLHFNHTHGSHILCGNWIFQLQLASHYVFWSGFSTAYAKIYWHLISYRCLLKSIMHSLSCSTNLLIINFQLYCGSSLSDAFFFLLLVWDLLLLAKCTLWVFFIYFVSSFLNSLYEGNVTAP